MATLSAFCKLEIEHGNKVHSCKNENKPCEQHILRQFNTF